MAGSERICPFDRMPCRQGCSEGEPCSIQAAYERAIRCAGLGDVLTLRERQEQAGLHPPDAP